MKNFNNILKLLTWNNQAFPIGSYSFSSGLEYAVESNLITTGDELQSWLKNLLNFGSIQTDAILLVEAWKLMKKKKYRNLIELNYFAISLNQSYEKYIENYEQGKSFIKITSDAWNHKFQSKNLTFPLAYASSAYQENIKFNNN